MKIVIAGGGTSAWMSAAALAKTFPHYDITVIRGGDPIGVGESTTPAINQYLKYMGIDDVTFLREARATYKSSSRFVDFCEKGQVFHYPNGQTVTIAMTDTDFQEWMVAKAYGQDIPPFADVFMPFVTVAEEGKMPLDHPHLSPYELSKDRSFHMDGGAFSAYLEKTFCENVKVIDSDVKSVSYDGSGVSFVTTERGDTDLRAPKVHADLFLDCTGQKSMLGGAQSSWIDYDTILTDTALVVKKEYEDKDKEMLPYTNAQATSAGWKWTIPTWDYVSKGYVYSSKHQDTDSAFEEFGETDVTEIHFRNGRYEEAWVGNCVKIGLSYGFIEPLESTSLFNTHHGILALIDTLAEEPGINQFARDRFNYNLAEHMDGWREFVEAHYYYSRRNDTPFWKDVTSLTMPLKKQNMHDYVSYHMIGGEPVEHEAQPILYILAGSGYTTASGRRYQYFNAPPVPQGRIDLMNEGYKKRKDLASTLPTMYKYLQHTVFNDV